MTLTDPNDQANPVEAAATETMSETDPASLPPADDEQPTASAEESTRRRILIGSQRDPAAYRPRPRHDVTLEDHPGKSTGGAGPGARGAG